MVDFDKEVFVYKRAKFNCELHHVVQSAPCTECHERTRRDYKGNTSYRQVADDIMNVVEEDLKTHTNY